MSKNEYSPKMFLRDADNDLLKQYFTTKNYLQEFDWSSIQATKIDALYEEIKALPEDENQIVENDFRSIQSLSDLNGTKALIHEAEYHKVNWKDNFKMRRGRGHLYNSFFIFLHHQIAFNNALLFSDTDNMFSRYKYKFKGLPSKEPNIHRVTTDKLSEEISKFFVLKQGRGRYKDIEILLRNKINHYFYVYLSDHPDTITEFKKDKEYTQTLLKQAFKVVFIYNKIDGSLEVCTEEKLDNKRELAFIFSNIILGEKFDDSGRKKAYKLDHLKKRDCYFRTKREHKIKEVRVIELKVALGGNFGKKLHFVVGPEGQKYDLYDFMDRVLDKQQVSLNSLKVIMAKLRVEFEKPEKGRVPTVTFNVTSNNTCNLKDADNQLIIKSYLKDWGIEIE